MSAGEYKAGIPLDVQVLFQLDEPLHHDMQIHDELTISDSSLQISINYNRSHINRPEFRSDSFFLYYGINSPELDYANWLAQQNKNSVDEELIRSGILTPSQYSAIIADYLGVGYNPDGPSPLNLLENTSFINKSAYADNTDEIDNTATQYCGWFHKPLIHVACNPAMRQTIEQLVNAPQIERNQICLTTEKALKSSVFRAKAEIHLRNAVTGLRRKYPHFSASRVLTNYQGIILTTLLILTVTTLIFSPAIGIGLLHVAGSFFYLALTLMRAFMILSADSLDIEAAENQFENFSENDHSLPTYSVLVALYKEAGQVPELIKALVKMDWPKDRLQILLICEADDVETIRQCRKYAREEYFEVIECPPCEPRTKPKALDFALPLARGDYLVLYDAEDRPHPLQLKEAFAKFSLNPNMACLQAPLQIHNKHQTWYTRMFAIEYYTLFGAILPVLEKWRSPFPLGGTSNHFRSNVLREIGAWDPFNVTEDADLGIRLSRFGYDCGTIRSPTLEEAPPVFRAWFPQRTRWIKGWIQTFLVHMRNPLTLTRDLGVRKSLFFHLVITSVVISVLIHPIFFLSAGYYILTAQYPLQLDGFSLALISLDIFNLVAGYTTYAALAWLVLDSNKRKFLRRSLIWIPIYWLMISFAGWRAFFQLFTRPFHWEKTQHGLGSYNQPN